MASEIQTKRIAKDIYTGRNGFRRGPTNPQEVGHNIPAAADRHRMAAFILENKKRSVPSLEQMKLDVETPDDLDIVQERVKRLQAQHIDDLNKLYETNAAAYLNEIVDRHASKPGLSLDPALGSHLKHVYVEAFRDNPTQLDWTNGYEQLRYTYLSQFIPLKKQQLELERQEEIARKKRAQLFPQSKEDFYNKPGDVRMRAARFLVADKSKQERMLSEYQWAWRQVKPLYEIFAKDEEFSSEVRSVILAAGAEIRDPRKRPA